ncbi:UvrB/UvrC motif-containing protein [Candidatus Sumerlaeota bacterium]|nr:UvrB/UvrC motif-containing protein [Candidatus Sumerlaeota bacterium]
MPFQIQKCEKCDRPATHKFTRITDGQATDHYLCHEHAAQFSPHHLKAQTPHAELSQLLAGLLKGEHGQKGTQQTDAGVAEVKCQTCGLSFQQYRQSGLLGCSDCYRSFEKHLRDDLRRYHGTVRHVGKQLRVVLNTSDSEKVETLRKRLELAIKDEDFELAAQLRDEIRQIVAPQPEGTKAEA